jgi:parvulin-like peptidyl-prolyl isomerase
MRFLIKLTLPALLAAMLLSACGGGGGSANVSSGDVAVVGSTHITQGQFNALLSQQKQSAGSSFPKQGTAEYEALKGKVVTSLVQQAERSEKAKADGIVVTDKQVENRLSTIKKQYFGGDDKKYLAQLKKQHLTDAQVRDDVRSQLVNEALVKQITKGVTVTDADIHDYYLKNSQLYAKPQSRDVRHILVKSKPLAESLYAQLKNGSDKTWCTLAKKYSQDPGSKNSCGKLTVSKGQTVPNFDQVAFSEKTKVVHPPIHDATYGWFVIEPLSIVHPRKTTPEKQVSAQIKSQLEQQDKNQAITTWINDLSKSYCSDSKIKYQVGYKPSPDPCASSSTTNSTTQ